MAISKRQLAFVQATLVARNKYIIPAQKVMVKALNKQLEPVIDSLRKEPSKHTVEGLVKQDVIKTALHDIYSEVGQHFAHAQYSGLMDGNKSLKRKKAFFKGDDDDDFHGDLDAKVDAWIEANAATYITLITDSTKNMVREYIADAISNGTGAADLASNLEKYFVDFNKVRAMRIARTEVGRASNFASQEARDMFGDYYEVKLVKTWLHAGSSPNDRQSHVDASGQTVSNNGHFDIDSGYSPDYPQDGSGGADEEANCNCCVYAAVEK